MLHFPDSFLHFGKASRSFSALLAACVLMSASFAAPADEIIFDDGSDYDDSSDLFPEDDADAYDDYEEDDSYDLSDDFLLDDGSSYDEGVEGISLEGIEEDGIRELTLGEIGLPSADPQRIALHLEALLQKPSATGSQGELEAAAYIESEMKSLGYSVSQQPFHEGFLNINGIDAPGVNLIAERGADSQEKRTKDILLLVTHYDSKTVREGGSPLAELMTETVSEEALSPEEDPYFNDKTGAAILLETARILSQFESDTDLCFLFLSGQEDGGYGAQSFIDFLSEENRSNVKGVLAVDRTGYNTGMPDIIKTLTGETNDVVSMVQECGVKQEAGLILEGLRPMPEGALAAAGVSLEDAAADGIQADGIQTDATQTDAIQTDAIELADATSLAGESSQEGQASETETETPEDEEKIPYIWSCLPDPYVVSEDADPLTNPDLHSIQSVFANAEFTAAQISQYDPARDLEAYQKAQDLGLADLTQNSVLLALGEMQRDGIYETADTFNDAQIIALEDAALSSEDAQDEAPDAAADDADGILPEESETEEESEPVEPDPELMAQTADVIAQYAAYVISPQT